MKEHCSWYAARDNNWWEQAQIKPLQAYWGAEIAAARLTGYLKPEVVTIYVRGLGKLLATHSTTHNFIK
jgi:hypothetical protein